MGETVTGLAGGGRQLWGCNSSLQEHLGWKHSERTGSSLQRQMCLIFMQQSSVQLLIATYLDWRKLLFCLLVSVSVFFRRLDVIILGIQRPTALDDDVDFHPVVLLPLLSFFKFMHSGKNSEASSQHTFKGQFHYKA